MRRWQWWLAGVLGLLVLGVLAFAIFRPVKVLPRIRLSPGFSLTDQDASKVTNEKLRGAVVLYDFAYAGCGERCAALDGTMREVQDRLGELDLGEIPVRLVTISFDPERDTPEALQAYARSAGADPERWRFATGDPKRVKDVIGGGFEVYYAPDGQGGFQFDPALALVDGWGIIRAEYRGQADEPDADRILRHIALLVKEARNSKGAARLAYEAAHFFLCYAH
jgi:protein SCO1/2